MRIQFSLMSFLLGVTLLALVLWNYSPRTTHVEIEKTNRMLDLAIVGEGFFPLEDLEGATFYTRQGSFEINLCGQIEHQPSGKLLSPIITAASDQPIITISPAGEVSQTDRSAAWKTAIGSFNICQFAKPEKLQGIGNGCFSVTEETGTPIHVRPGEYGTGYIAQGWLEQDSASWTLESNLPILMLIACVGAATIQVWVATRKARATTSPTNETPASPRA